MLIKIYIFILKFFTKKYLIHYSLKQTNYNPQLISYIYDDVTRNILIRGNHEREIQNMSIDFLKQRNIKFNYLIDCGAHIGTCALNLIKNFKKIYAVESYNKSYQLLKINTTGYKNIFPINASLSNENKNKTLSFDKNFICGASLNNRNCEYNTMVETTTLDQLFSNKYLENLCIKIDVEGHEYEVLKGSETILSKYRPIVFVEINKNKIVNGYSDVFNFLKRKKYKFYNVQPKNIMLINLFKPKIFYFLSNFSFFNKLEVVEINKLLKIYQLYKFLICIPEEKI